MSTPKKSSKKYGSFSALSTFHGIVMEAFDYQKEQERIAEAKNNHSTPTDRILQLEAQNPGLLKSVYKKIIDSNQIQIFLQEKVSLRTGENQGFETLVRAPKFEQLNQEGWSAKEQQLAKEVLSLNTEQFCNMAKEASMSYGLDAYIIYNTMRVVKQNPLEPHQVISINVHPDNIARRGFADWVSKSLAANAIEGSAIRLEVVESDRECSLDQLRRGCDRLKDKGVGLSIDDYCTGASHPAYLHYVPAEELKIPRPFLLMYDDPNLHERAKGWIGAMVAQGKERGMKITVEGVETQEHVKFLREIGVDNAQGYYFSKPTPAQQAIFQMKEKQEIDHPENSKRKLGRALETPMIDNAVGSEVQSTIPFETSSLIKCNFKEKRQLRSAALEKQNTAPTVRALAFG